MRLIREKRKIFFLFFRKGGDVMNMCSFLLFFILLTKGIMKLLRNMRRNFKSLDDRSK